VTLSPIAARRGSCTALSLISAVLVVTLPAGDPLRPLAGLLLAGPLPAWSIDRFVLARSRERPSAEVRCSLAVGFTLVAVVGVGLLLAVTPIELKVVPLVIGLLIVIAACDLSSAALPTGSPVPHNPRIAAWGLACVTVGLGLGVASFVVARDSAVSASRRQATAYAYLLGSGTRYQVMLANPTSATQRFLVAVDRSGVRPVQLTRVLDAGTQLRVPVATTSGRRRRAFTVTATVTAGPQRGLRLRLTAPASG
jgi:hypothetical protein